MESGTSLRNKRQSVEQFTFGFLDVTTEAIHTPVGFRSGWLRTLKVQNKKRRLLNKSFSVLFGHERNITSTINQKTTQEDSARKQSSPQKIHCWYSTDV